MVIGPSPEEGTALLARFCRFPRSPPHRVYRPVAGPAPASAANTVRIGDRLSQRLGIGSRNEGGALEWIVGSEHDDDDARDEAVALGMVPLDDDFDGLGDPPAHPRGVCDVVPVPDDCA